MHLFIFNSNSNLSFPFSDSDFDFFVNIKDIIPEDIKITMRKIYGDFCQKRTFTKIIPILQARTPILKCTHIVTGFSCDINFTNSRGIYNSNIIRFLLQYDKNQRIYFLAIVLKYWAKVYNLSGTGKITNYALIMMLVFFLQSLREPILPPLIDFQKNTQEIIIDHWNFGWNFNFKYITKNTMTIVELLAEFFEFYNSYDFEKNIICPLIGRPLKKTDFVNQINSTNLIFKRYFEYIHIPVNGNNNNKPNELNMSPAICIQDAFEMSHNIASSCGKANFATFKLALAGAVKVCKEHEKSPMKTSELLIQLLSIEIVIGKDEMKRIASGLFSQTYNPSQARKFMCKLNSLAVELKLTNEYATILNKSDELPKKTEIQQIWAQTLMEYIPNLLEKMFFFEVKQLNQSDIDEKDRKCDGLILNENSIKFYALKASVNIWTNHRVNRNANLLTTEQRILSDKYTKAECATNLDCDMIIRFPTNNNFCEILFTDKLTEGQEMMKFFEFFILNIRSYFTAYLTQKLNDIKNVKKN